MGGPDDENASRPILACGRKTVRVAGAWHIRENMV